MERRGKPYSVETGTCVLFSLTYEWPLPLHPRNADLLCGSESCTLRTIQHFPTEVPKGRSWPPEDGPTPRRSQAHLGRGFSTLRLLTCGPAGERRFDPNVLA